MKAHFIEMFVVNTVWTEIALFLKWIDVCFHRYWALDGVSCVYILTELIILYHVFTNQTCEVATCVCLSDELYYIYVFFDAKLHVASSTVSFIAIYQKAVYSFTRTLCCVTFYENMTSVKSCIYFVRSITTQHIRTLHWVTQCCLNVKSSYACYIFVAGDKCKQRWDDMPAVAWYSDKPNTMKIHQLVQKLLGWNMWTDRNFDMMIP